MQRNKKEQKQNKQAKAAIATTSPRINKDKVRKFLLGSKEKQGLIKPLCIYALLICIGFIYINPILHMISTSFMDLDDLLDSSINWIPSALNLSNYAQAAASMDFWPSFGKIKKGN